MIDLDGNSRQYYDAKKVYEWTIIVNNNKYNIYIIYSNDDGNLLGFGWKDEEQRSLMHVLNLVRTGDYKKLIPLTLTEYRKEVNEVRRLKVSKNKANSYSLYLPATWAKEFLNDDMYVDVTYQGDCIVIRKSEHSHNNISEK